MVAPINKLIGDRRVVLGSQSPRRMQLLRAMGIDCTVLPSSADEEHTEKIEPAALAQLLALRKADALTKRIESNDILITADTVVALRGDILEKPGSHIEAKRFLERLSGVWHTVYTGFVVRHKQLEYQDVVATDVRMLALDEDEIEYYIRSFSVLDKAGGYGIQDWIGYIGVSEIRGCYNNVVGLPSAQLYSALKRILTP